MSSFKIKTSAANKARITELTNKWNLGAENVIARLAFAYSLKSGEKLDIRTIQDSKGKEYSAKVLFRENVSYYVALVSQLYRVNASDPFISKLIKLHIDHGIEKIYGSGYKSGLDLTSRDL